MKYKIGEEDYKTKKEISNRYRMMLNSYELKQTLSTEDHNALYNLIEYHTNPDKKLGKPVSRFSVGWNRYNTRSFYIHYEDGTYDDVSIHDCIGNIKPNK